MGYLSHTREDLKEMLAGIGISSIEEMFSDVPESLKKHQLKEQAALSEQELQSAVADNLSKNKKYQASFLGAGSYDHYIPAVIDHLAGRSEFYTAYTPYQPEASQGTLKVIFEYQSMICELTGCDIANASMYDGASALGEAVLMACAFTKRSEIVIANEIDPKYKEVLTSYTKPRGYVLQENISDKTAAVVISQPDFFGNIETRKEIALLARENGAKVICISDPHLLAVLQAPGEYCADIVVAEGQPLGILQSFGGPGLGILAAKNELSRFIPGRIVGRTVDRNGKEAYVLTMQTREQHIRREKATSNICSNQALCALRAAVYMSLLGAEGLQKVAKLSKKRADLLKEKISKLNGYSIENQKDTYKEFVVNCPVDALEVNEELAKSGILGGYDLGGNRLLLCCTEKTTVEHIDLLVNSLEKIASWTKATESCIA